MNHSHFNKHNIILRKSFFLLFPTIIVIVNLTCNSDAFAITYHYEPFFTTDGSTILDVPDASNLKLSSFTIATWFKTTGGFPDEGIMVNKGGLGSESAGANQNYGIWFTSSDQLQGGFETTSGTNRYITLANNYIDGQWHHGVVTFDNTNDIVRLFVDGVQIATLTTTSNPDNTGIQPFRIGGNAQSLTEDFFIGQLDEVGIWNRALTNAEITNLKDNGVFASSGLVYSNSFGPPPPSQEICNNGLDDDRDGLKDAEDLNSCPAVPEICNNGLDDDRDGLKDAADPDCQTTTTGYHYEPFFTATGSNKLDVPDASNLKLSSFTIATWFKTTGGFPDEGIMVNKGGLGSESAGANQNYGIWFTSSDQLQGGFETTSGTNRYITLANNYIDGQWHHGVVTFDNTNDIVRLFVDGVQIATLTTTSNPDNTGIQPFRIGGNAQSLTEDFFIGQLDEVGIWNRALTINEITNLMNNGIFTTNGLVYKNSFTNGSPPTQPEICGDTIDNDGDGLIDEDCPPPSTGEIYPVPNITWIYDSQLTLRNDITLEAGDPHPNDPVLFPSSASGVDSHSIRNGWLEVDSGGGSGRVFWNYHEVPQFSQIPTAGYNTVMTGKFMFKPGIDNLSIKDGNHGTNGWVLDGQLVFGGFGITFQREEVESDVEYWHDLHENGDTVSYPTGLNLVDNKEYKFFLTLVTDRVKEEVLVNAWLDFGDGKGWIQVMKDSKWGHSEWSPGSVPDGDDKADILKGPSFIKKHHIWTRASGDGILPIKDIKIGTLNFIS